MSPGCRDASGRQLVSGRYCVVHEGWTCAPPPPPRRPKPGDRVRVTVEGTWQYGPWIVDGEQRSWFLSADGIGYPLSGNVHVEVVDEATP